MGPLAQKIAQTQASVCTGSPPQNALSCSITSPQTVLAGSPINYSLTSTGPATSAKVQNTTIVPFNGSHQGSIATTGPGVVILQAAVYSQAGSSAACGSKVVRVVAAPSCTLTASPSANVTPGTPVTLSLNARGYVSSAKINGATVALTGNVGGQRATLTVNPTQSTTYTANVYGPNGPTASCEASVTMATQTSCNISFSPSTVERNGVSTVTFSATGPYTNPTLNGDILSGTLPHSEPARTGTVGTWSYTGTVRNQAGQGYDQVAQREPRAFLEEGSRFLPTPKKIKCVPLTGPKSHSGHVYFLLTKFGTPSRRKSNRVGAALRGNYPHRLF